MYENTIYTNPINIYLGIIITIIISHIIANMWCSRIIDLPEKKEFELQI